MAATPTLLNAGSAIKQSKGRGRDAAPLFVFNFEPSGAMS